MKIRLTAAIDLYLLIAFIAALGNVTTILILSEARDQPVLIYTNNYQERWPEIIFFTGACILAIYRLPKLIGRTLIKLVLGDTK